MAISAGRLTQMISVLNPVLTRNAAGEMTEEWVSCGKIHADIRGRSSRERMQSGAEMAQAEIRIWVRGQAESSVSVQIDVYAGTVTQARQIRQDAREAIMLLAPGSVSEMQDYIPENRCYRATLEFQVTV
ncbi:head-tail adaptor protein [Escherichia coli]|uniref:head-tail adaptor protein n=1 Tax=Escherichia coli TaxID=562 RepID=UPI000BDE7C72|nr:head-tail adaptor protein [Escherichia coli]